MDPLLSPDRTFRVDLAGVEMRMSHTVMNAVVTHVASGDVLLDLTDTLWDAAPEFEGDGSLVLHLREYPGSTPGFTVRLDLERLEATFLPAPGESPEGAGGCTIPIEDLWRSLAPLKRVPEALGRRRRALDDLRREDDRSAGEARRREQAAAERASQDHAARQAEERAREADLDRQRAAREALARREENERFMRELTARAHGMGTEPVLKGPAPAPSAGRAAGAFARALAGLALTLGSIGIYLALGYALAAALVRFTPLHAAPAWVAWGVASTLSGIVMIVAPFALLAYLMRNYRG